MSDDGDRRHAPPARPPTSRLGRLAKLAGLAPRGLPLAFEGAKRVLGKPREPAELDEKAQKKLAEDAKKTAEALLKTFGEMKGLPLKVGQMASYIDGLAPPGYEDRFREVLRKLQDRAPPLSPEAAVSVVRAELGDEPERVFAEWEREPFAAASIGQVHRAVTKSGERVAVKVQYPGIDKAIENDLKSLSLFQSMISPITSKLRTKQTLEEIKAVFLDELDYSREAEMADLFRRINADDHDVYVPKVFHSLSTRRVLTTELMGGLGYRAFCDEAPQSAKNQAGKTIWRFTFRSMLRYGHLYADPHPGNYRFLEDGRVAFLDFGCVKVLPDELVAGMKRYISAAMDEDWEEFDRACVEVLGYDPADPTWDVYRAYTLELLGPLCMDGEWECSPEKTKEHVQFLARGLRPIIKREGEALPNIPYVPKMPQDFTFVNRLQWGLASVLAGMRTTAAFRPILEPYVREPGVRRVQHR